MEGGGGGAATSFEQSKDKFRGDDFRKSSTHADDNRVAVSVAV